MVEISKAVARLYLLFFYGQVGFKEREKDGIVGSDTQLKNVRKFRQRLFRVSACKHDFMSMENI